VNSLIKVFLCKHLFTSGVTTEVWARGKLSWNHRRSQGAQGNLGQFAMPFRRRDFRRWWSQMFYTKKVFLKCS